MTRKLFPHQVGHFIGLDVHDTLGIPLSHDLRPGQVISIEPGLYIPDEDIYPEKYRGIGKVYQIEGPIPRNLMDLQTSEP